MKPETLAQLTVGALVTLKSGGPAMTVAGWEDDTLEIGQAPAHKHAHCSEAALVQDPRCVSVSVNWIAENGTPQRANYLAAMLKPY